MHKQWQQEVNTPVLVGNMLKLTTEPITAGMMAYAEDCKEYRRIIEGLVNGTIKVKIFNGYPQIVEEEPEHAQDKHPLQQTADPVMQYGVQPPDTQSTDGNERVLPVLEFEEEADASSTDGVRASP